MERNAEPFIVAAGGTEIHVPGLREEDIHLRDIAHALSNQCRFLGHCSSFYSVAQHSVFVMKLLEFSYCSQSIQLAGLLHDAHEAYTGDFPAPFKATVAGWRAFEDYVEKIVRRRFRLEPDAMQVAWAAVKEADTIALHFEAYHLFHGAKWYDKALVECVPEGMRFFSPLEPKRAKYEFLTYSALLGISQDL